MSVLTLYKKFKEILTRDKIETQLDINFSELFKIHTYLDEKFETFLTDTTETDKVFNDATANKTLRRQNNQTILDFKNIKLLRDEDFE